MEMGLIGVTVQNTVLSSKHRYGKMSDGGPPEMSKILRFKVHA